MAIFCTYLMYRYIDPYIFERNVKVNLQIIPKVAFCKLEVSNYLHYFKQNCIEIIYFCNQHSTSYIWKWHFIPNFNNFISKYITSGEKTFNWLFSVERRIDFDVIINWFFFSHFYFFRVTFDLQGVDFIFSICYCTVYAHLNLTLLTEYYVGVFSTITIFLVIVSPP